MTIHADATLPAPRAAADVRTVESAVNWRSSTRDHWVGHTADRRHAGTIERVMPDYIATDGTGVLLGVFPSLAEAEAALATLAQLPPVVDRPFRRAAAVLAAVSGAAAITIAALGLVTLGH